jgi:hypothetical protein
MNTNLDKRRERMANYENKEQLKKHLSNAIGYMKHDRT